MSKRRATVAANAAPSSFDPRLLHTKAHFVLSSNDGAHVLLHEAEKDLVEAKSTFLDPFPTFKSFLDADLDADPDEDDVNRPDSKAAYRRPVEPVYERLAVTEPPRRRRHLMRAMLLAKPRRTKVATPGPKTYEGALCPDTSLADKYKVVRGKLDVYQVAINHLSDENIARQGRVLTKNLVQQEIDRLQYHVNRAATLRVEHDEERQPRTAVYRHASRFADLQNQGIRIYNLAPTPVEPGDKVVVPRQHAPVPSTPANKVGTQRRFILQQQPRFMKNAMCIERLNEHHEPLPVVEFNASHKRGSIV
uniref:Uncharacterized protein n=1 Tax=Achlya hypogyna TaxID=1202772 RepID=A0A1V9Z231_ACHHY|nr:hypothetical protein ACHHYP_04081 [Achlya hypogyna]